MKKLLLVSSLFFALNSFSQEKTVELNCYNKWAAKFEERGAEEIKDGVYEDVIITVRRGSSATCNSGKVEVREGKVVKFYNLLSDGSHEEVVKTWKNKTNENVTITNGISKTMMSAYNELVNVLWPNKIKPKKAKPVIAPEPTDD
jgi:S-adenosylmethionine synthetase